jgi:tetratricopeptide (TPR) repeat protein
LDLARDFFVEAAEAEPAAGIRAGDLAVAEGKWDAAAKLYSAARSATSDATLYYLYGYALAKSGAVEAAEKQMRLARLMALAPEARLALAVGLRERGLKQEAEEELELVRRTALCDSPPMANAASFLGPLVSSNEPRRAAECFEQRRLHALNVRGDFSEVEAYLGAAHFIHRMNAKAALVERDASEVQAEIDACEAVWPSDVALVVELLPDLNQARMSAAADALFDRAYMEHQTVIEEFPKSAMHLNNTAWICARAQRKLDEALTLATKAVELAPDESAYRDTLAEVHFQRGDREAAVKAAEKCLEIAPDNKMFAARLKHFREDEVKTLDRMEMN